MEGFDFIRFHQFSFVSVENSLNFVLSFFEEAFSVLVLFQSVDDPQTVY